jgi:hypothetical protein
MRRIIFLLLIATTLFAHPARQYTTTSQNYVEPTVNRSDLINESFEGSFLPAGWSSFSQGNTYQWSQSSDKAHTGTYSAWVRYGAQGTSQDEWLVLPVLDLTDIEQVYLEWYEDESYWSGYGDHHYIMVSTTSASNPSSFTAVSTMTPANHEVNGFLGDPVTVDLSSYAGESAVYVAFKYIGVWADDWFIDDVRVYEPDSIDGAITNITPNNQQYTGGDIIAPVVTVANVGLDEIDPTLELNIIEAGIIIATFTEPVGPLAAGAEIDITFNDVTLSNGQFYQLSGTLVVSGDTNSSNNNFTASVNSWTETHAPLIHLQTNAGCDPCVSVNQALDSYVSSQGNLVSAMRIHAWWPGSDAIYDANIPQNQEMISSYVADYVPHMWVDGIVDVGSSSTFSSTVNERKLLKSPMTFDLAWDPDAESLRITVNQTCGVNPNADYRLRVALVENNVYYAGGNGETIHNQAFRRMYPSTTGIVFDQAQGEYTVDCSLEGWQYENLKAVVYLQDQGSWEIIQSATKFLSDIEYDPTGVVEMPSALKVTGAVPNPFNPSTEIRFATSHQGVVVVTIYDSSGSVVKSIGSVNVSSGNNAVTWNGKNNNGNSVASGVYYAQVKFGSTSETTKLVLAK